MTARRRSRAASRWPRWLWITRLQRLATPTHGNVWRVRDEDLRRCFRCRRVPRATVAGPSGLFTQLGVGAAEGRPPGGRCGGEDGVRKLLAGVGAQRGGRGVLPLE